MLLFYENILKEKLHHNKTEVRLSGNHYLIRDCETICFQSHMTSVARLESIASFTVQNYLGSYNDYDVVAKVTENNLISMLYGKVRVVSHVICKGVHVV